MPAALPVTGAWCDDCFEVVRRRLAVGRVALPLAGMAIMLAIALLVRRALHH